MSQRIQTPGKTERSGCTLSRVKNQEILEKGKKEKVLQPKPLIHMSNMLLIMLQLCCVFKAFKATV